MFEDPKLSGIESRRYSPRYTLIQSDAKDMKSSALIKEWNLVLKAEQDLAKQQQRLSKKQRDLTAAKKELATRKASLSVKIKKAQAQAKA